MLKFLLANLIILNSINIVCAEKEQDPRYNSVHSIYMKYQKCLKSRFLREKKAENLMVIDCQKVVLIDSNGNPIKRPGKCGKDLIKSLLEVFAAHKNKTESASN